MLSKVTSFIFSPFQENTYILYDDTREAVIVDPGCLAQHEKEELAKYVEDNKLIVKALLQTHTHLDLSLIHISQ
ncbi:MAG: MBL fold metallo-hydrolase, partial [Spirosomataceae bacterium]